MLTKPFAWSYSALRMYENCPKQYWHLRVAKDVRDKKSQAQLDGDATHKHFEKRIKFKTPLPEPLARYEPLVKVFELPRWLRMQAEPEWALDRNLKPVGWFDASVWVRAKADLAASEPGTGRVLDWKTGRPNDDTEQLKLLNVVAFAEWPDVDIITSSYIWLKNETTSSVITRRSETTRIWTSFFPRVTAMEQAVKTADMPPQPGPLCRFCPCVKCPHHPTGTPP